MHFLACFAPKQLVSKEVVVSLNVNVCCSGCQCIADKLESHILMPEFVKSASCMVTRHNVTVFVVAAAVM
jgi:hypothetical protein